MTLKARLWQWLGLLALGWGGCGGGQPTTFAPSPSPFVSAPQPPVAGTDGWEVSTLEAEGIDLDRIESLARRLQRGDFGAVHDLLLVRHGRLVYEQYFGVGSREALHEMQSVTKSVMSALVGIAVDRGQVADLEQPLEAFLPERAEAFRADPAKSDLRLRHLLTMTAGLDWDETTIPYTDARNSNIAMNDSFDWTTYVLSRRVVEAPGVRFNYTSGCPILLGDVLRQVTGLWPDDFAAETLFRPLGIERYSWYRNPRDPRHPPHTGGGLSLRARDLAKFGELYLRRGTWRGTRILSEEWVEESSRFWIPARPGVGYGYYWWLRPLSPGAGSSPQSYGIVAGEGAGGQYVFTIASLDLIVVMNADNRTTDRTLSALYEDILPAVR